MKQILTIACFTIVLFGCSTKNINLSNRVTIIGDILNNQTNEVEISNIDTTFVAEIDSNGHFKLSFQLNKPGYFHYDGNESTVMYISPGDSIHITLNTDAFDETLLYSGKGAEVDNYLSKKYLLIEMLIWNNEEELYLFDSAAFLAQFNLVNDVLQQKLNTTKISNQKFVAMEQSNLDLEMACYYYQYSEKHQAITGKPVILPKYVRLDIDDFDINNVEFLEMPAYEDFIRVYFNYITKKKLAAGKSNTESEYPETVEKLKIIESVTNTTVKQKLYEFVVTDQVHRVKVNDVMINSVKNILDTLEYASLYKMYNDLKPLQKGNKAPGFTILDENGKEFTIDKFKGKYLYMDVWSTTCGPCNDDIPFLKRLKADFINHEDLTIISVCLSDETAWKKKIMEKGLTDDQYRAPNGWKSELRNNYINYWGVPCYVFFDREGNIIDARAPRPSENIRDLFAEYGISSQDR